MANNDEISDTKRFAVVKFMDNDSYSEIPTCWLTEDNTHCYWPSRTANSATLIANCTSPNFNTWSQFEVEIIRYCCKY